MQESSIECSAYGPRLLTSIDDNRKKLGGNGPNNGGSHFLFAFVEVPLTGFLNIAGLLLVDGFFIFGEAPVLLVDDKVDKCTGVPPLVPRSCISFSLSIFNEVFFGVLVADLSSSFRSLSFWN